MNQKEISVQSPDGDFTPDKAWLLGLMAGDGHLCDHPEYRTYGIVLAPGPEEALARETARTIGAIYGDGLHVRVDPPKRSDEDTWIVATSSVAVVEDLKTVAPFGIYKWRVPERILKGSKETQAQWVAGFCDADGCAQHKVMRSSRYVCMDSVNDVGLRQVAKLLANLGIDHSIFPNRRKKTEANKNHSVGWKLLVSHRPSLERFVEKIPLRCQEKKGTLAAALLTYKKQVMLRNKDGQKLVPEIEERLAEGQCYAQIAAETGLRKDQVRQTLRYSESDAKPGRGHGERHQQIQKMWPEMRAHFDVGKTIAMVAEFFGLEHGQVKGIMRSQNYKYGRGRGRESERGDALRAALPILTALADSGLTNKEICALPEVQKLDLIPTRLGAFFSNNGYKRPVNLANKNRRRKQIDGEDRRDKERTARKVAEWEALNAAVAAEREANKPKASEGASGDESDSNNHKENA